MQRSMLAKRGWVAVFIAIAIFYFFGLTTLPFIGPDEPRYAEVAREMLLRHDLITPTLGGQPWFQKPALLYWMIMASFRVLGVSEYAARVGPQTCGLLTAFFVYLIARRVEREPFAESAEPEKSKHGLASWSAVALLSSAGLIVFSRAVVFDVLVTMTMTAALSCFFLFEIDSNQKRRRWLLPGFYACVGLSLLAKGLIGIVIPFAVIGLYSLFRRELPCKGAVHSLWWGIPLAISVAALWYGPMIVRHGWPFIDDFFVRRHFARFISNEYPRPRRFYYYLPILALQLLPWTIFLVSALVATRSWNWRGPGHLDRMRVFATAWVIAPLAFFSLAETKLPGYILPLLPGAALLVGDRFVSFLQKEDGAAAMRLTGALVLLFAPGMSFLAVRRGGVPWSCVLTAAIPAMMVGGFIVFSQVSSSRARIPRLITLWLMIAITFMAWLVAIVCGAPVVARRESLRDQIRLASARGYGDAPVYNLHHIERTSEFYAAGRVAYATSGEPLKLEGPGEVAEAARQHHGPILVIVPIEYVWQLTGFKAIQSEVIGDNGVLALVAARTK